VLKFLDSDIDPVENRQIPKEIFHKVPLIQELVNQLPIPGDLLSPHHHTGVATLEV
jgi:hypothetical protein